MFYIDNNLLNDDNKFVVMAYIRLHDKEKEELEELAGEDYSMNEIIRILLDDFLEYDDDEEEDYRVPYSESGEGRYDD